MALLDFFRVTIAVVLLKVPSSISAFMNAKKNKTDQLTPLVPECEWLGVDGRDGKAWQKA